MLPDMKWFLGVVEDISDPEKMDRVRVRIAGYHTENKAQLPTSGLQWAIVMDPTTSAAVSGVGQSHALVCGSWVMGIFLDGEDMQQPAVMFSMKGKPQIKYPTSQGFSDPNGEFPRYTGEPDTNRLARNEGSTIVSSKNSTRKTGVQGVSGDWSEPASPYAAQYPYNKVKETPSGHIQEFDDTPGAERVHTYHRTGTYDEMQPDGSRVEKVIKDHYTVVLGDDRMYVGGKVQIYVDGDAEIITGGDINAVSQQNVSISASGEMRLHADGRMWLTAERIDLN